MYGPQGYFCRTQNNAFPARTGGIRIRTTGGSRERWAQPVPGIFPLLKILIITRRFQKYGIITGNLRYSGPAAGSTRAGPHPPGIRPGRNCTRGVHPRRNETLPHEDSAPRTKGKDREEERSRFPRRFFLPGRPGYPAAAGSGTAVGGRLWS